MSLDEKKKGLYGEVSVKGNREYSYSVSSVGNVKYFIDGIPVKRDDWVSLFFVEKACEK